MDSESSEKQRAHEEPRRTTDPDAWTRAFQENLFYVLGRFSATATLNDKYLALAYSVRDQLLDCWVKSSETYYRKKVRTVCYLSAEFMPGPQLGNNLLNLGAFETAKQAIQKLGLDFEKLLAQEEEPGLGSGGLGRLAACFLDSLATLQIRLLTVFGTSLGFSTSRSVMGGKSK